MIILSGGQFSVSADVDTSHLSLDSFLCIPSPYILSSSVPLVVRNGGGTDGRDWRSYPRVSIASQTPRTTRLHYLYGLSKRIRRETRDSKGETAETRDYFKSLN